MKTGLISSAIGLLLLVLLLSRGNIRFTASTVDIHLFDTYFVIVYFHFILFLLLVLGTFFSIGTVAATGFHNKYYVGMLLAFVLADAFVIWTFKDVFQ